MALLQGAAAEVFSLREVARAADVPVHAVRELTESGRVVALDGYVTVTQALRCIRLLRLTGAVRNRSEMFAAPPEARRSPGAALAASGALHLIVVAVGIAATTLGLASGGDPQPVRLDPARLVFLATPGPGGGGGGGGLRQPAPPPRAELKTAAAVKSPVPAPKRLTTRKPDPAVRRPDPPVAPRPEPRPVDPPPAPPAPAVTPQVTAPVPAASSDPRDRPGVVSESTAQADSQGPGTGAGVGTGAGTGIGEGTGSGVGPGTGGGTGGGPYRPGSGITAPSVLHEVRPDYTEEARRQGVEGDVVLELVVRRDGTVGDVKVLQGLGAGLDRRAIDAVRRWRFAPARRYGTPVDVLVEVAVEFKLR